MGSRGVPSRRSRHSAAIELPFETDLSNAGNQMASPPDNRVQVDQCTQETKVPKDLGVNTRSWCMAPLLGNPRGSSWNEETKGCCSQRRTVCSFVRWWFTKITKEEQQPVRRRRTDGARGGWEGRKIGGVGAVATVTGIDY